MVQDVEDFVFVGEVVVYCWFGYFECVVEVVYCYVGIVFGEEKLCGCVENLLVVGFLLFGDVWVCDW